jgi:hypothetical protein
MPYPYNMPYQPVIPQAQPPPQQQQYYTTSSIATQQTSAPNTACISTSAPPTPQGSASLASTMAGFRPQKTPPESPTSASPPGTRRGSASNIIEPNGPPPSSTASSSRRGSLIRRNTKDFAPKPGDFVIIQENPQERYVKRRNSKPSVLRKSPTADSPPTPTSPGTSKRNWLETSCEHCAGTNNRYVGCPWLARSLRQCTVLIVYLHLSACDRNCTHCE